MRKNNLCEKDAVMNFNAKNKFEKNKEEANMASMVKLKVLVKLDNFNGNNYINISVNNNYVENALVASMVKQRSNKPCLSRLPGSNPGQGVSTFSKGGLNE